MATARERQDLETMSPPMFATVLAWRAFKRSHDVREARHCCCEKTKKLFDSLDELEAALNEVRIYP